MLELLERAARNPWTAIYTLILLVWGAAMIVEAGIGALRKPGLYSFRDTATNLSMYAGYILLSAVWANVIFVLYGWLHAHAVVRLTMGAFHFGQDGLWWEWVLLFLLEDLCFYCFHRASHGTRFFWAAHVPHHSSSRFNLSTAFRQTWTPFFAVLFWLPLPLLGFDPLMVLTLQAASLTYQIGLHTSLAPRLGPLEWVLNTPTHHRLHHAANPIYLGKNLGGVLIVWDRLFGTFARETEPVRIGVEPALETNNPLTIAFAEWGALLRDLFTRRSATTA